MTTHAIQTSSKTPAGSAIRGGTGRGARLAAAILTLGAAAIHFAVVPDHLAEYLPFGLFFLGLGAAQIALALLTVGRPSRGVFGAGAAVTLAALGLWAVSRTVGLPFGPAPGVPEMAGIADLCVVLLEAGALGLFGLLTRGARAVQPRGAGRPHARGFWRGVRFGLRVLGQGLTLLVAGAVTAIGVLAGTNGMPLAVNMSAPVAGAPAIALTSLHAQPGPEPVKSVTLTAQVAQIGGQAAWTYNGTVPGPELRVTQGDRLRVTLVNHLPAATTIHWHGVRVPNAEDGVAGLTQDAVAPGQSFTYEFVVPDAGTYWYHSHQDTETQIGSGLYGALVVLPRRGPVAGRDYAVMLHSPPGGRGVVVNEAGSALHLAAQPGDTVRLRLINAVPPGMDGGPEAPVLLGAPYRVVALDGQDLTGPQPLGPERLALGMGQRADLLFTMPATGSVRLVDTEVQGTPTAVEQLFAALGGPPLAAPAVTIGDGPAPAAGDLAGLPIFDPTHYGTAAAEPLAAGPFDATYPLVLTTGPGFRDGRLELRHLINGQASPDVPPIIVHEGQLIRLHIVNDTAEYHPIHLHGHTLTVLAKNGLALAGSPRHLDTVLIGPHETWDVAFRADNPGLWMIHCHVLLHASFGMSAMIEYAGVVTPFEMGTRSGNIPE